MIKHFKLIFIINLILNFNIFSLDLKRAIVATDTNPMYYRFWPIVANSWKKLGIRPTLALIVEKKDKDFKIDETLGDVIKFEAIEGIPTGFQAQVIRLLLPIYFEDECCITGDIDMLALSEAYFKNSIKHVADDCFVIYRDAAYRRENYPLYPMCYNAAKGKVFKELFKINNIKDIPKKIKQWYDLGFGWTTDERMIFKHVCEWESSKNKNRIVKLGHEVDRRIDRGDWNYDKKLIKKKYYVDSHMLRPYEKYKKEIDELCNLYQINC